MTATNYNYTLENEAKVCREIDADEFATLDLTCEFQGAMDLEDGIEFANAITASGEAVKIYRESA